MALTLAGWLVRLIGIYLALGVLFAVPFVMRGAARVDPAARGAGWGFRLLILPGVAALWPLLARRWLSDATSPPEPRDAHRGGR
jgi:hypothetical protein